VYNIRYKFDGGASAYKKKLPTAARDGLLRPEELVGGLAIREATAEVVGRGCRHSESHGSFGYGDNRWPDGPWLWRATIV